MRSLAVYDLVSSILRARPTTSAQQREGFRAPLDVWIRTLSFEGCTVQFERGLQAAGLIRQAPAHLRRFLLDATGSSLRRSLIAREQLIAIGALAGQHAIRVLVLKGAARLLAGTLGGTRSIADIDLLVAAADAGRLHALLQAEHGYVVAGPAQRHHLAPLSRLGSLSVEIHVRLTDDELPLDAAMWQGTRRVSAGAVELEIPSPTNLLLHALEHATTLNWMSRYRLRDILDVAACFTREVCPVAVRAYVRRSPRRAALETILSAAHEMEPRIATTRPNAWATVRRVSRTRLVFAVASRNRLVADRLFRYVGVLAEASPRTMVRAGATAGRWVRAASLALVGA